MLCILPLLFLALTATAQTAPVVKDLASTTEIIPQQFTSADTIRALHNLFKSKRSTGGLLTGGSAFFTTLAGIGTLADNNGKNCGGYFCPDTVGSALIIGIGTAPAWIPGSISLIRFNKRKETAEIENYTKTRKLPLYLQRRLAGRFFNTNYRFKKKN